jgi:predicted transcriptional regulator
MKRVQVQETKLQDYANRAGIPITKMAKAIGVSQHRMRRFLKGEQAPSIYEALLLIDLLFVPNVKDVWKVTVVEGIEEVG